MDKYKIILKNIDNKDFEKAEKICSEIKDIENDYIALNLLGLTQIKQNKYNLAEKNFTKSLMINENFEPSIKNLYLLYLMKKNIRLQHFRSPDNRKPLKTNGFSTFSLPRPPTSFKNKWCFNIFAPRTTKIL